MDRNKMILFFARAICKGELDYIPEEIRLKYLKDPGFNAEVISLLESEDFDNLSMDYDLEEAEIIEPLKKSFQNLSIGEKIEMLEKQIPESQDNLQILQETVKLESSVFNDESAKISLSNKKSNPKIYKIYFPTLIAALFLGVILILTVLIQKKNSQLNNLQMVYSTKTDTINYQKKLISEKDNLIARQLLSDTEDRFVLNFKESSKLMPPQQIITRGAGGSFEFILVPKMIYRLNETLMITLYTGIQSVEMKIRNNNLTVIDSTTCRNQNDMVSLSFKPEISGLFFYEIYNVKNNKLLFQGAFFVLPDQK
jgi:hypothetical protein